MKPLTEVHSESVDRVSRWAIIVNDYLVKDIPLTLRIEDNDEPDRPWQYKVYGARVRSGELQINTCDGWVEASPGWLVLSSAVEVQVDQGRTRRT